LINIKNSFVSATLLMYRGITAVQTLVVMQQIMYSSKSDTRGVQRLAFQTSCT